MKLIVKAICKTGLVRHNNEDALLVGRSIIREGEMEISYDLNDLLYLPILVADGMGGHELGEYASYYLLEQVKEKVLPDSLSQAEFCSYFEDTIIHVSNTLNSKSVADGLQKAMGSTLTGLLVFCNHIYLTNIGDSRVYRYRDGMLRQLSVDQENEFGQLVNCVGAGIQTKVQIDDITDRIIAEDEILICSDGLTDMVDNDILEKNICSSNQNVKSLYQAACNFGGKDNVSIILITFAP